MVTVILSGRMMSRRTSSGFTLIEILIALVVFTVAAVTLVRTATIGVRQAGLVQERTEATWIAENEMTRLRLFERNEENYPGPGTQRTLIEQGRRSWEVETEIEATENDFVRRITIRVSQEDAEEPSASLVGFIGRY